MTPDEAWDKYCYTPGRLIPFDAALLMLESDQWGTPFSRRAEFFMDKRDNLEEADYFRTLAKLTK